MEVPKMKLQRSNIAIALKKHGISIKEAESICSVIETEFKHLIKASFRDLDHEKQTTYLAETLTRLYAGVPKEINYSDASDMGNSGKTTEAACARMAMFAQIVGAYNLAEQLFQKIREKKGFSSHYDSVLINMMNDFAVLEKSGRFVASLDGLS